MSSKQKTKFLFHYTYVIIDLQPHSSKRWYIGKRSCWWPIEEDFNYMGSSTNKEFKQLIKYYPNRFKKVVLETFETNEEALQNEIFLHTLFDVGRSHYFYNLAKQTSTGFNTNGNEEVALKAKLYHIGISPANKGVFGKYHHSLQTRKLISEKVAGEKHPNFGNKSYFAGKVHTDEAKEKQREAKVGEKNHQFGKTGKLSPRYGKIGAMKNKKHSEESKLLMSEKRKLWWEEKKKKDLNEL